MNKPSEVSPANQTQTLGEYLSTLKEGDTVYRVCQGADLDRQVIARITKTQIILWSGGRYNRDTGASIGSTTWTRTNLLVPTDDVKQRWREMFLARWFKSKFPDLFKGLTIDQQLELYRQAKAFAATNKVGASSDASSEENPCLS